MFRRLLELPPSPRDSFFLWGPRQTGKSTLLRQAYPDAIWLDLLKTDEMMRYLRRPATLREEIGADRTRRPIVIDEIQKVPGLLDEVHWLIENRGRVFALAGSSARKARRTHANLLGGRALRRELFGLVSAEIGGELDLVRLLNHGFLPRHYQADDPVERLDAYVNDYLREEIAEEGIVRSLPAFADFLTAAALTDGGMVNYTNIASECGVSAVTVRGYFQILEDTLLGRFLPAWTKRPKRRTILAPKFYFSDVGVVNSLARRGPMQAPSELFGKAFESWVHHELRAFGHYRRRAGRGDLTYWRLASGIEVDFVLGDMELAVEAKASANVSGGRLGGLRALAQDHPRVKRRIVASLEPRARRTEDGIDILPWRRFAEELWAGSLA